MKKYVSLLLATATLLAFSCTKVTETPIENAPANAHVAFKASVQKIDTKATITPNAGDTEFESGWVGTDQVSLYAYSDTFEEEKPATWNTTTNAFEADFESDVPTEKEEWIYKAKYPYDSDGIIPFGSARTQNGNNYNSAYDIMYGTVGYTNAFLGKDNSEDTFVIPMSRLTGIAYFHITGGDSNADVLSATLSVNTGNIAAETVAIKEEGDAVTPTKPANSITISFPEGQRPKANDIKLWFNVLPGNCTGMKLVIKTADKTASIASKKPITYTAGELNKVVLSGLNWVDYDSNSITWTSLNDWTESVTDGIGIATGNYTVKLHKDGGSTTPTINGTANDARVYANGKVDVIFDGYAMSKIVFNLSSQGKNKLATITSDVGTICTQSSSDEVVVWVGKATSVTFTVGSKATYGNNTNDAGQLCFSSIDVETVEDGLIDSDLAFSEAECTAFTNVAFVAPTLTNTHELPVTYSSTNTNVATINSSTGAVTILAAGSTTIKAAFAGNSTYRAITPSYDLTVVAPSIAASDPAPAKAGYAAGSESSFTVTANCTWEAVVGEDEDNIIGDIEIDDNTVTVVFNANTEETEKSATVIVRQTSAVSSAASTTVNVIQKAKTGAAANGTTLWLEPFTGFSNSEVPSSSNSSTTVFGGGSVTYACTVSGTQVYALDNNAEGEASGELLIKSNGTLTVTGIPTGEATGMTLSFKSNNGCTPTTTTTNASIGSNLGSGKSYVYSVSVPANTETITLVFTNSTGGNTRVDDLKLVAGAPIPTATVTTNTATNAASATGQTVTLNGTITLVYGASWDDVSECGFKYTETGGSEHTVTVTKPTTGTSANITTNVSGLTKNGSLTYYAYAVYNSANKTGNTVNVTLSTSALKTYTYNITTSDFTTNGYGKAMKTITATATDGSGATIDVDHATNNAGLQSGKIQFKKSEGYLYNTTDLGTVVSAVLNSPSASNSYTVYKGTSQCPSSAGTGGYFKLFESGGNTLTCSSITVTFTK